MGAGPSDPTEDAIRRALATDRTIDIVTTGARTGRLRTTEIWFTNLGDRIVICGTPSADGSDGRRAGRDWLANLRAHPAFTFRLKESVRVDLAAVATPVLDMDERRAILRTPQTRWYRDHSASFEALVRDGPVVVVRFRGPDAHLNLAR